MSILSRRQFLGAMGASCAVGLTAACSKSDGEISAPETTPPGWDSETRALPIPPLAEAKRVGDRTTFTLIAQTGKSEIQPGLSTPTWGFNGPHLGPTLRASRGEKVDIHVISNLMETTAVHWHGLLVPAISDGGPHSPIQPASNWTASFTVEQPAATLWYHPHPHGVTGLQAYRGLAGMFIIDDDVEEALDLPREYGVDDIPVVLMDANFHADGSLDETLDDEVGLLGEVPYVNGITNPYFQATTRRVRLRLLDGSNMRFHNIGFSDGRTFHVIATDSGLLAEPYETQSLMIGPGERVEILVDLEPGEEVRLRSLGFADNLSVPDDEYTPNFGLKDIFDLLLLRGPAANENVPETSAVPAVLDPSANNDVGDIATTREFELNTFQINGEYMDMDRVDVAIDHSDAEEWIVTNGNSDWMHNFHIHNAAFRVLEISGTEVEVPIKGWKDTVSLPPHATVRLGVTFGQFRDKSYPYMYHCHMLFHEDQGMMGQYVMLNKGETPELDTEYTRGPDPHGH
ncbi:Multicopper oxidase [Corynebacterium kutscheri]|uniref:multicopper oxidase domain-containing protein n=1 Tax=Corynebacterium kutscheri TaxID=35755 RepID=UPI000F6F523D|nr:multicopper oxidase domain-containing protein [Corynebacterium kutscheri]VEH80206.1 Multicopper oxidase [Corynebacterium kutscheri]